VRARIHDGDFDLVLWASGGPVAQALIGEVAKCPDTQFAYLDAFLAGSGLEGAPNASAFFLLDGSASYLAGYLSALVSKSGKVSVVGGIRDAVGPLVHGFEVGAKAARPRVDVQVG
jgi:basic membrane lipoprotein Med (substrate-binding protein (PBP1-ABC) superfamily)